MKRRQKKAVPAGTKFPLWRPFVCPRPTFRSRSRWNHSHEQTPLAAPRYTPNHGCRYGPASTLKTGFVSAVLPRRAYNDLEGEELWEVDELQIPVYHTAYGECPGIACSDVRPDSFFLQDPISGALSPQLRGSSQNRFSHSCSIGQGH